MPHTILLVDDEQAIVSLFKSYLEYHGFRVLPAYNAVTAVQLAVQYPIDAIVTDMRMPGVHGQELLECLREHKPDLPAIVVSGYTSEFTKAIDERTRIFSKPLSLLLLVKALHDMLSSGKAEGVDGGNGGNDASSDVRTDAD